MSSLKSYDYQKDTVIRVMKRISETMTKTIDLALRHQFSSSAQIRMEVATELCALGEHGPKALNYHVAKYHRSTPEKVFRPVQDVREQAAQKGSAANKDEAATPKKTVTSSCKVKVYTKNSPQAAAQKAGYEQEDLSALLSEAFEEEEVHAEKEENRKIRKARKINKKVSKSKLRVVRKLGFSRK